MESVDDKCRLCLGEHDSINIRSYIDGKTKLMAVLDVITGVSYPESQTLPKNLCEECFDKARDTYHFQQMCHKSLDKLVQSTASPAKVKSVEYVPAAVPAKVESKRTKDTTQVSLGSINQTPNHDQETILFDDFEVESEIEEQGLEDGEVLDEATINQLDDDVEEGFDQNEEEVEAQQSDCADEELLLEFNPRIRKKKKAKETFSCGQCTSTFGSIRQLKQHTKESHRTATEDALKIYLCTKCMKKCESQEALRLHENECDNLEAIEKPFVCNVCNDRFTFQRELKAHQTVHDLQKRFFCTHCMMRFTRSSQVALHMRTHTQEKPYQCPECQMAFAKKTNMVRHMQMHKADHLYVCSVCEKAFKWETSLKVHMNTHSQARIYKCDHCEKEYTSMSGYRKHLSLTHATVSVEQGQE